MKETLSVGKELIVRKRMSSFLEKLLRFCGYDFRHDLYKQIIYGEAEICTPLEEKIKNFYDAYHYLLYNSKRPLNKDVLNRFFYLLSGKECDKSFLIKTASKFFYLNDLPSVEKAIEFHMFVYAELNAADDTDRLIISLMFFNYTLIKSGIPTLRFVASALQTYVQAREKYLNGDRTPLYEWFWEQLRESKFQDKTYYGNLKPLSLQEISDRISKDKNWLQSQFGIRHVYVFGSFAKELQRIDSDIDLMVVFSQNLSYEKKMQNVEELSTYYFNVFNRFIDFLEISEFVNEEIIKEVTTYLKIY